eukprot:g12899.t1
MGHSATVKKDDGKWKVDTSYIGHRTGDTDNLTRKEEKQDEARYADPSVKKYSHQELKASQGRPPDVDPARREMYLSEADFAAVFGMPMAEFQKQPKWKQQNAKRPGSHSARLLRAAVLRNSLEQHVRVVQAAAGAHGVRASVHCSAHSARCQVFEDAAGDVQSVALDSLTELGPPERDWPLHALKIDVEGSEEQVIHGAQRLLASKPLCFGGEPGDTGPRLFLELHAYELRFERGGSSGQLVDRLLDELGYQSVEPLESDLRCEESESPPGNGTYPGATWGPAATMLGQPFEVASPCLCAQTSCHPPAALAPAASVAGEMNGNWVGLGFLAFLHDLWAAGARCIFFDLTYMHVWSKFLAFLCFLNATLLLGEESFYSFMSQLPSSSSCLLNHRVGYCDANGINLFHESVRVQVVLSPVESQSLQLESPSLWTLSLVLVVAFANSRYVTKLQAFLVWPLALLGLLLCSVHAARTLVDLGNCRAISEHHPVTWLAAAPLGNRSAPSAAAERVAEYCWVPPLPNLHGPSAARAGAMVEKEPVADFLSRQGIDINMTLLIRATWLKHVGAELQKMNRTAQQEIQEVDREVQEARDKCSVFTSGASKVVKKVEPLFDQVVEKLKAVSQMAKEVLSKLNQGKAAGTLDKSMGVVIDQANVWKSAMEGLEKKLQETHHQATSVSLLGLEIFPEEELSDALRGPVGQLSSAAEALRGMATQTEEAMAGFVDGALEAAKGKVPGDLMGNVSSILRGVQAEATLELQPFGEIGQQILGPAFNRHFLMGCRLKAGRTTNLGLEFCFAWLSVTSQWSWQLKLLQSRGCRARISGPNFALRPPSLGEDVPGGEKALERHLLLLAQHMWETEVLDDLLHLHYKVPGVSVAARPSAVELHGTQESYLQPSFVGCVARIFHGCAERVASATLTHFRSLCQATCALLMFLGYVRMLAIRIGCFRWCREHWPSPEPDSTRLYHFYQCMQRLKERVQQALGFLNTRVGVLVWQ